MLTIATVGPKAKTQQEIKRLIEEGANGIRINFSHCDYESVKETIRYIKDNFQTINIIGDIQGHKIRVGRCFKEVKKTAKGEIVYFCSEDRYEEILKTLSGRKEVLIPLTIKEQDLLDSPMKTIYMKDGSMEYTVTGRKDSMLQCRVVCGGVVRAEKGCNLPGLNRQSRDISDKDLEDIKFCIKNKVDTILYSYVYDDRDIVKFKGAISKVNMEKSYEPKLWAKIETEKAINNIKSISENVDGVVLGRGDLLPETNIYKMALYQHNFIRAMKNSNKDVIIATHVLDSLKENYKPTVNEMNDIFYCIGGGVSGFMLTGETSVGRNPVNAVVVLKKAIDFYTKVFKKN